MTRVDEGAGPGARPGWRWDVALSFAGAQRDYVEQVAKALQVQGTCCFYDADEQIELWGKYLAEELPVIYSEQAAAAVVFVSAEYAARDWTRLERRAALNRAVRERREYVLPARFDDTPLPGLLSDMVAIDLRGRSPQQFAAMIAAKLAALGISTALHASAPAPPPIGINGSATSGATAAEELTAPAAEADIAAAVQERAPAIADTREELKRRIDDLHAFEREHRSRLKAYLQGQLRNLEAGVTHSDALLVIYSTPQTEEERVVYDLRVFEFEYRSRLKAYLQGQLRDVDAPETGSRELRRPVRPGHRAGKDLPLAGASVC